MKKMIAGALVGVAIILQGIYVWYIYMTTFVEEGNHVLFGLSLFQVGVGVYILFRASKPPQQSIESNEFGMPITKTTGGTLVERNTEMMNTWQRTTEFRDKLKLLQGAVKDQEKKPMT